MSEVKTALSTRFTARFGLRTPIALAPMAGASGGDLAAACARSGALGLVGGGYGDLDWTRAAWATATAACTGDIGSRARLGAGFITWKLDEDRTAFDWLIDTQPAPKTVMLSFGNAAPYVAALAERQIASILQVQNLAQLREAAGLSPSVIVVQGGEAGGHGANADHGRATFSFVPEAADYLAAHAPDTLLLAAGGVADGRGVAAALMLGADGVLVGSRLWATIQSLATEKGIGVAVQADGDDTRRGGIFDILREKNWPTPYDFRALRNALHRAWEGNEAALAADPASARAEYAAGVAEEDYSRAHLTVGEAVGLIRDMPDAGALIARMTAEAHAALARR